MLLQEEGVRTERVRVFGAGWLPAVIISSCFVVSTRTRLFPPSWS